MTTPRAKLLLTWTSDCVGGGPSGGGGTQPCEGVLNMKAKGSGRFVVRIGHLYVRDYPARFGGDFTLTPSLTRAATFHVDDVPKEIVVEINAALGVSGAAAEIIDPENERRGQPRRR